MSTAITPNIFRSFSRYLSLIKFSHTVFALPFAFIGFTMAIVQQHNGFAWSLLIKMLLCMVFARSAAMAFNRYLDRNFDALNPRTAQREIPAGIIKPTHALLFTIINCILFVATTWFINILCFYLSFVALFIILFYSYTKRITALCHLVLGLGLSLSPIGAYLSVCGHFALVTIIFSLIVLTWVSGFDIIYALQDEAFDKSNDLYSIPSIFGIPKALKISTWLHSISGMLVLAAGYYGRLNWLYWIGAAIYLGLLVYQHLLVKPKDLSKVNMAFANTNGLASVLFAAFTISSILIS